MTFLKVYNSGIGDCSELTSGEQGVKIQIKKIANRIFDILILSRDIDLENQVAYLILQVAHLVGNSDKEFWLTCNEEYILARR